jgi:hypothetical protein
MRMVWDKIWLTAQPGFAGVYGGYTQAISDGPRADVTPQQLRW